MDEAQVELYVDQRTFVMSRGQVKINWEKNITSHIFFKKYFFQNLDVIVMASNSVEPAKPGYSVQVPASCSFSRKTQNNNIIVICKIAIRVIVVV